jgi:hypothetical protein
MCVSSRAFDGNTELFGGYTGWLNDDAEGPFGWALLLCALPSEVHKREVCQQI